MGMALKNSWSASSPPADAPRPIIKKDSLGISIPSSKINNYTWNEIENVFNILISNYKMKIYDLYSGQEITKKNFNIVKSNLFG